MFKKILEAFSGVYSRKEEMPVPCTRPAARPARIKSLKDLVEFFHYETGDRELAVFLADVLEKVGRDGYVDVKQGGDGKPFSMLLEECREDPRSMSEITAVLEGLKKKLSAAASDEERDSVEREIAVLAGGLCTVFVNLPGGYEYETQSRLIVDSLRRFKEFVQK